MSLIIIVLLVILLFGGGGYYGYRSGYYGGRSYGGGLGLVLLVLLVLFMFGGFGGPYRMYAPAPSVCRPRIWSCGVTEVRPGLAVSSR